MKLNYKDVFKRIQKNEEIYCYASKLELVYENYFTSSPHIYVSVPPIYGTVEIDKSKNRLTFHKEKDTGNGFVKKGRLFSGLESFSTYKEAVEYYNKELTSFIKIKESEIKNAKNMFVDLSETRREH